MEQHRQKVFGLWAQIKRTSTAVREFGITRSLNVVVNAGLLFLIMFAHLWTPLGDIVHLYNGFGIIPHTPIFLVVPFMNLAALVVLFESRYLKRFWRVCLLIWSILYNVAVYWGQSVLLNGSNDSPQPNGWVVGTLVGLMAAFLVISIVGAIQNLEKNKSVGDLPNPTHGPSSEFGQNPFVALLSGFASLSYNWLPTTVLSLVAVAIVLLQQLVSKSQLAPYLHNVWLSLGIGLIVLLLVTLINAVVFIFTIASSKGQKIQVRQGVITGVRRYPALIWMAVMQYFFIFLGLCLFVIPGIIILFRLVLAPNIVLDSGIGPWKALKLSNQLMKKNAMQAVGVIVLLALFYVAVFMDIIIFGPWIGEVGSALLLVVIISANAYFNRLYHRLDKLKHAGYTRLRVNWANILLLNVGIVLAIAAPIAVFVFLSLNSSTPQVTYNTACFQVTLPAFYHVQNNPAACKLTATTSDKTFIYEPVVDNALSADQLSKDLKSNQFPSPRYAPFLGIPVDTDSIDGEDADSYNLWDSKLNNNALVSFVSTTQTFIIAGKQVRNFELIDHSPASQINNYPSFEEDFNPVDITNTILWPPYGSDDYQNAMGDVADDMSNNKYDTAVTDAKAAASLADNDYARSLAFSAIGDAYFSENNDSAASTDYEEALTFASNNTDALDGMASVYYDANNYNLAISYASKTLTFDDTYADAYDTLGLSYFAENNQALAVQNAEKAVKLDPGNDNYESDLQHILSPSTPAGQSNPNIKT